MGRVIRLTETQLKDVITKIVSEQIFKAKDSTGTVYPNRMNMAKDSSGTVKPKPVNVNNTSCLKGFEYVPKNNSQVGPYSKIPASYHGKYNGKSVILYVDGSGKIFSGGNSGDLSSKKQNLKWKCNGTKLELYDIQSPVGNFPS
jgi:hypothetical protein